MASNAGHFRKGPDPRRHRFSHDECSRGGWVNSVKLLIRQCERHGDTHVLAIATRQLCRLMKQSRRQRRRHTSCKGSLKN
jgi:hypothetical protein